MKEIMAAYLSSIGMAEPFRAKVESVYDFYRHIYPDEITGMFVTDYLNADGSRVYENLWFFSLNYCTEAKLFLHKDDFDMVPIRHRVKYWSCEKQDYDFEKAIENSRLTIKYILDSQINCSLRASRENCDYLKEVFLKYIVPNVAK